MLIAQLLFQPEGKCSEVSCKFMWFTSVQCLCSLLWLLYLKHLSFSSGFVPWVFSTYNLHDCMLEKSFIFLFWVIYGLLTTHGENYSLAYLFHISSDSVFINLNPPLNRFNHFIHIQLASPNISHKVLWELGPNIPCFALRLLSVYYFRFYEDWNIYSLVFFSFFTVQILH